MKLFFSLLLHFAHNNRLFFSFSFLSDADFFVLLCFLCVLFLFFSGLI